MRKPPPPALAATKPSLSIGREDDGPVKLVCMALMLALVALACRIATIW
jgi:hypothetical protein